MFLLNFIPVQYRIAAITLLVVAALAASFASGFTVSNWRSDGTITSLKADFQAEQLAARIAAEKKLSDAVLVSDRLSSELAELRKVNRQNSDRTKERIVYVEKIITRTVPAANLATGWVRLYNEPLVSGGSSEATSGSTDTSDGAYAVDSSLSGITEWDALRVHAVNAERWRDCRAQLNALIEWHSKTGEK